jgi:hypothetical protein
VLGLFLHLGLSLAQLLDKLVNRQIDRGVEIILGILSVKIGTGEGHMDLDLIIFFLGAVLVKKQDDMSSKDLITEFLKMSHLVGHMGVNGGCELDMTGTDVDLHRFVSLSLF